MRLTVVVETGPTLIVDVATLTGTQKDALGDRYAAILGTSDRLVSRLIEAGALADEPGWRLPLVDVYRSAIKSNVADLRNLAPASSCPSTIQAGAVPEQVCPALGAVGTRRYRGLRVRDPRRRCSPLPGYRIRRPTPGRVSHRPHAPRRPADRDWIRNLRLLRS
jgi:leucyl aminopeptidase